MMITDLKNGLFAHLPLHYLMNTRDESILQIPFAKKAMGPVLLDNVPIRSLFFISLRLKERIIPNSRQTFI
jgi:hypothetical protein